MMDVNAASSPAFMDGLTSPLQNHRMVPLIELNMNTSLLSSPLGIRSANSDDDAHDDDDNENRHHDDDDDDKSISRTSDATPQTTHEALLKQASTWVRELEAVRDDLRIMSVRNAILLDSLAMAGATGDEDDDDRDDDDTHLE